MVIFKTKETRTAVAVRSVTDIDGDLLAWRSRRDQLGRDRENSLAREGAAAEKRGETTAELVPDEKAVKAARSAHAAAVAEREEIEMAITTVDARLHALDVERAQAERRRLITTALAALDRARVIAGRVDAAWAPILDEMERFIHAADDAALALKSVYPTGRTFAIDRARLKSALLWPVGEMFNLGYISDGDRISAVELVAHAQTRVQLETELAGQEGRQ